MTRRNRGVAAGHGASPQPMCAFRSRAKRITSTGLLRKTILPRFIGRANGNNSSASKNKFRRERPSSACFPESPEIAANLHSIAIHTIQQLAGLTAHGMQTVGMGAQQWQDRAKQFLAAANGGVGMHRLNAENEKLKNAVEVLQNQNAMMKAQLDLLMAERRQGVAPNMLPPQGATLAQAHAASVDQRVGAYVLSRR